MYSKNSEGIERQIIRPCTLFSQTQNVLGKIVLLKKVLYGTRHPMRQKDYMDSVDTNQPRHL